MAGRKLTELTTTESLSSEDLVYVVDIDAAAGLKSKGITKANLAAQMGTSVASSEPVENEYANIAALIADQGSQTTSFLQYVVDASADPNIASGEAYYEKLATSTGILADDYRLLSDTEVEVVRDSNSYRVFRIQAIQDDGTPLTSVNGGRISFEYSGTDVTAILFNQRYTDAILEFYGKDVNVRFYNRSTRVYQTEAVASGAWTTVSTNYYRAAVTGTNIQIADLSVNNRVEFFIVEASSGGLTSIVEDTTPQLGGELDTNGHSVGGDSQSATGDGTTTIDWKLGNIFDFQFGAFNEVFTFTAPTKAGTFILKLVQDSVGSRTATFPAAVKWTGGTAPTLTTTATTGTDIITFYYDGTSYFAVQSLNFS